MNLALKVLEMSSPNSYNWDKAIDRIKVELRKNSPTQEFTKQVINEFNLNSGNVEDFITQAVRPLGGFKDWNQLVGMIKGLI